MRKPFIYVVAALLALVLLEASARLALRFVLDTDATVRAHDIVQVSDLSEILHPYFGHAPRSVRSDLNKMPPPERHAGTKVIALVGGAAASDVATPLRNGIVRHFLASGSGVEPVFLDFTNEGYRQPQQAIILSYMLVAGGEFDVVVNIDGHEEIVAPIRNASAGRYPFFPSRWFDLVAPIDRQLLRGEIEAMQDARDEILRVDEWSAAMEVVRRVRLAAIDENLRRLYGQWAEAGAASDGHIFLKSGPRWPYDMAELPAMAAAVWSGGSRVTWTLAEAVGAAYHHFLQPSCVASAGPLGEELANVFEENQLPPNTYSETYGLLARHGRQLAEEGIDFVDLSSLLRDATQDRAYVDNACRIVEGGRALLAEKVLQHMVVAIGPLDEQEPGARGLSPVAQAEFDVYRVGNYIAYAKQPCSPSDTEATFFLRETPLSEDLLLLREEHLAPEDEERRFVRLLAEWNLSRSSPATADKEIQELNFDFDDAGSIVDDQCVATVPLSDHRVAGVRTGQIVGGEEIWAVEFAVKFGKMPAAVVLPK